MLFLKRLFYIIIRLPRIVAILQELYGIIDCSEMELDDFLDDSEAAFIGLKRAKNEDERHMARKQISDLIAKL